MEVLEIREEIDESEDTQELEAIEQDAKIRYDAVFEVIKGLFDEEKYV